MAGRAEEDAINSFINDLGVEAFPHTADSDGSIWAGYGIATQPAFVFINDDGETSTKIGALGSEGLASELDALL